MPISQNMYNASENTVTLVQTFFSGSSSGSLSGWCELLSFSLSNSFLSKITSTNLFHYEEKRRFPPPPP